MTRTVHILGIGGTFMAGVAVLARELGFEVTGSDTGLYPPMSTQLAAQGIEVLEGYLAQHLKPAPDCVVVGNVMSRGNPAVEYMLDQGLNYTSGPAFLAEHLLRGRWVLAVAGTHGKTTTASLLAWLLDAAGLAPGFLIGGVPDNFGVSARLGAEPFFVIEADEYDTAFFDKRSKFVHYRPRTLVLNNLEYDHADIFPDLAAIERQFHHLVRTVPGSGLIVASAGDAHLDEVLAMGCWTPVERFVAGVDADPRATWTTRARSEDGSDFDVLCQGRLAGRAAWSLFGLHSMHNALAAIAAARHAGVPVAQSIEALAGFRSVKRRLELRAEIAGVRVYDDFAHHPTAIAVTLDGLRRRISTERRGRILAVLEPRSNTMRMGVHRERLAASLADADEVYLYEPAELGWALGDVAAALGPQAATYGHVDAIVARIVERVGPGDHVVIMSNGAFDNIHVKLMAALGARSRLGHQQEVSRHHGEQH